MLFSLLLSRQNPWTRSGDTSFVLGRIDRCTLPVSIESNRIIFTIIITVAFIIHIKDKEGVWWQKQGLIGEPISSRSCRRFLLQFIYSALKLFFNCSKTLWRQNPLSQLIHSTAQFDLITLSFFLLTFQCSSPAHKVEDLFNQHVSNFNVSVHFTAPLSQATTRPVATNYPTD